MPFYDYQCKHGHVFEEMCFYVRTEIERKNVQSVVKKVV